MANYSRSPLKWAGGKYRILDKVLAALPPGDRLVEPFAGSAVVSLNADYREYLLCDLNEDLIHFYRCLIGGGEGFVARCAALFTPAGNSAEAYYYYRNKFNELPLDEERAAIFLYLNRHAFNGLMRYNSAGRFNTPFGRYKKPYFPQAELDNFVHKSRRAKIELKVADFKQSFALVRKGDVLYCDPPYVELSGTSRFREYTPMSFGHDEQVALARCAREAVAAGASVLLSNHDTELVRQIYADASCAAFNVRRSISCVGHKRLPVGELLITY